MILRIPYRKIKKIIKEKNATPAFIKALSTCSTLSESEILLDIFIALGHPKSHSRRGKHNKIIKRTILLNNEGIINSQNRIGHVLR